MKEGIVGGEAFGVDARMIVADAYRRRGVAKVEDLDPTSSRAVAEYLSVLDAAAFGAATPKEPTSISPTDPATRYTAAADTPAFYAYAERKRRRAFSPACHVENDQRSMIITAGGRKSSLANALDLPIPSEQDALACGRA
jgi:hypothetical protein